jgi:hypothetical protein
MQRAVAAIATPKTDAALKRRYGNAGAKAYKEGKPRQCPGDPNSMVGGWWFEGYDAAAAAEAPLQDVSAS